MAEFSRPRTKPKILAFSISRTWPTLAAMASDGKDDSRIAEIRSIEQKVISSYNNVNSLAELLKHLRVRTNLLVQIPALLIAQTWTTIPLYTFGTGY